MYKKEWELGQPIFIFVFFQFSTHPKYTAVQSDLEEAMAENKFNLQVIKNLWDMYYYKNEEMKNDKQQLSIIMLKSQLFFWLFKSLPKNLQC